MRMVSIVERSMDAKLSNNKNVSATWAAQDSCPESCPLMNAGCYAELGNAGFVTRRLNGKADQAHLSKAKLRLQIAQQEAEGIRELSGSRKLRVHAVGDCTSDETASIVGQAMVEHENKQGKLAWTYTHAWRDIRKRAWRGARVLASCNSVEETNEARRLGYGTSVLTPKHPSNKVYTLRGETIIPCPAQFKPGGVRVVTCETCTLCMRGDWLRDNRMSVGFQPDRGSEKKLNLLLGGADG